MSDVAQVALITGGIGFLSLLASFRFNWWSLRKQLEARLKEQQAEHEERYRLSLYDKRLEVHQQAYKWLMDLIEPLRVAMSPAAREHER